MLAYLETSERYKRVWRGRGAREAGWLTTSASKPEMVARMGTLLRERPEMFMSRRLCWESAGRLLRGERGKTGAASGSHDDLVMAMAVAQAVRADEQEIGRRRGGVGAHLIPVVTGEVFHA